MVIGRPVGPLALQRLLPPSRKSSRQAASRCASTCSSRESAWRDSPRSNRSTASVFLPADHLGPGPVATGPLVWVLVVHRHDRHLHPCLLGVQENRERWTPSRSKGVIFYRRPTWRGLDETEGSRRG
jgi:hypothetical protein